HQRVAIRIRARHRLSADDAARSSAILDDKLLAEDSAQALREQPRYDVGGAARREWDNDAHRPVRPLGRRRGQGNNANQNRWCGHTRIIGESSASVAAAK